jgi:hypothetical protein
MLKFNLIRIKIKLLYNNKEQMGSFTVEKGNYFKLKIKLKYNINNILLVQFKIPSNLLYKMSQQI